MNKSVSVDYNSVKSISGWFSRTDFEIFKVILDAQDQARISGAVAEIGVHHGKSFVVMASHSGVSKAYAIDLFENQALNIDRSGHGDKAKFLETIERFGIDPARITVDARPSDQVKETDLKNAVGPVRFFHIDGGHHINVVKSDIDLAWQSSADGGVIALDDVFRPEWPEVSMALFDTDVVRRGDLVCFAIGFNKSFFCRRQYIGQYQSALTRSAFLSHYLSVEYQAEGEKILVFQSYPLPEWTFRKQIAWWLSIYAPDTYVFLKRLRNLSF